jgi:hypothetical protein
MQALSKVLALIKNIVLEELTNKNQKYASKIYCTSEISEIPVFGILMQRR